MNHTVAHPPLALLILLFSFFIQAEQKWPDNSLTILQGEYEVVSDKTVNTFTLEHLSAHTRGSVFAFVDRLSDGKDYKENYLEISPRLKVSQLIGSNFAFGSVTDTYESSSQNNLNFDNQLYGFGIDLAIPWFRFFSANVYYADNELKDNDWQLTLVYGKPFSLNTSFGKLNLYPLQISG